MVTNTAGSVNDTATANTKVKENGEIDKEASSKNEYPSVKQNSEEAMKTAPVDPAVRTDQNDMSNNKMSTPGEKQTYGHVPVSNGYAPNSSFNNGGGLSHPPASANGPQPNGPYPNYGVYPQAPQKQGAGRPAMHGVPPGYMSNQRYPSGMQGGTNQQLGQLLGTPSRFSGQYPSYSSHGTTVQGDYSQSSQQSWPNLPPQYARPGEQNESYAQQPQHYGQQPVRYMPPHSLPRYAAPPAVSSYQPHQHPYPPSDSRTSGYPGAGAAFAGYPPHNHMQQPQHHPPYYPVRQPSQQPPHQHPYPQDQNSTPQQQQSLPGSDGVVAVSTGAAVAAHQSSRPNSTSSVATSSSLQQQQERSMISPNRKTPSLPPSTSQPSIPDQSPGGPAAASAGASSGAVASPQSFASRQQLLRGGAVPTPTASTPGSDTTVNSPASQQPMPTVSGTPTASAPSSVAPTSQARLTSASSSPSVVQTPPTSQQQQQQGTMPGAAPPIASLPPISNTVSMPAYGSPYNRAVPGQQPAPAQGAYQMHPGNYPQHQSPHPQGQLQQQQMYANQSPHQPRAGQQQPNVIPTRPPTTPVPPGGKPHQMYNNQQPHTPQPTYSPAPPQQAYANTASPAPTERRLSKQGPASSSGPGSNPPSAGPPPTPNSSTAVPPSPDTNRQGAAQAAAAAAVVAAAHTAQTNSQNATQAPPAAPVPGKPAAPVSAPPGASYYAPPTPAPPNQQLQQTTSQQQQVPPPQQQIPNQVPPQRVMPRPSYMQPTADGYQQPHPYQRMPHPGSAGGMPRMPVHASPGGQPRMHQPPPASMYGYPNQHGPPQPGPYPGYYPPTSDHTRLPTYAPQMSTYPSSHRPHEEPKKQPQARSASQKLAALYEPLDEPGRRDFIDRVLKYWEDKNLPLKNAPLMGKKTLDLFLLYRLVKERGFMQEVTNQKKWNEISTLMKLHSSSTSGFTLKKQYCKYLYGFECRFERGEEEPQEALSRITEANRKKKNVQEHASNAKAAEEKNNVQQQSQSRIQSPMPPRMPSYPPQHTLNQPAYGSRYSVNSPAPQPGNPAAVANSHGGLAYPQHYGTGLNHNMANNMSPKPPHHQQPHQPQMYPPQPLPTYPVHSQPNSYPPPTQHQQQHPQQQPGAPTAPPNSYPGMLPQPQQPLVPTGATPNDKSGPSPLSGGTGDNMKQMGNNNEQQLPTVPTSAATPAKTNQATSSGDAGSDKTGKNAASAPSTPSNDKKKDTSSTPTPPSLSSSPHPTGSMVKQSQQQYKMPLQPPVHPGSQGTPVSGGHMPAYQPRPPHDPYSRPYHSSSQQMPPPSPYPYYSNSPQRQAMHSGYPSSRSPYPVGYPNRAPYATSHQQPGGYQPQPSSGTPNQANLKRPGQEIPGGPPQNKYPRPEGHYQQSRGYAMPRAAHPPYGGPSPVSSVASTTTRTPYHPTPGRGSPSIYRQRMPPQPRWRPPIPSHPPQVNRAGQVMNSRMMRPGRVPYPRRVQPIFPPGCVEATEPKIVKFNRKTCRDVGSLEAWRVIMSLKSGLLVESTWALNVLTILLYDNQTVHQFKLSQLPGLLDSLVGHYRRYLAEFFTLPSEREALGVTDCATSSSLWSEDEREDDGEEHRRRGSSNDEDDSYSPTKRQKQHNNISNGCMDDTKVDDDILSAISHQNDVEKPKASKGGKKKRGSTAGAASSTSKLGSKYNSLPIKIEPDTPDHFLVDKTELWDHVNQLNATDNLSHIVVSFLQEKIKKDYEEDSKYETGDAAEGGNHQKGCHGDKKSDHGSKPNANNDEDAMFAIEATLEDVLSIPTSEYMEYGPDAQNGCANNEEVKERQQRKDAEDKCEEKKAATASGIKKENEKDRDEKCGGSAEKKVKDSSTTDASDKKKSDSCEADNKENKNNSADVGDEEKKVEAKAETSEDKTAATAEDKRKSSAGEKRLAKSKIERVLEQHNVVLLESEAIGDEGNTRGKWAGASLAKRSRRHKEELALRLQCVCNIIRGLSFLTANSTELFKHRPLMRAVSGMMLIRHKHRTLQSRVGISFEEASSLQRQGAGARQRRHLNPRKLAVGVDTPHDSYQCFSTRPADQPPINEYTWFAPKKRKHDSDSEAVDDDASTETTSSSPRCLYSSTVLDESEETGDVYTDTWWWNHVRRMREDAMVILCNITPCVNLAELPDDRTALAMMEACLHWTTCPSSEASDPFNSESYASGAISPQNISLEILTKLSLKDQNVDLMLATKPYSRLEKLFSNLINLISDRREVALREFSFVLLSNLAAGDVVAARAIAVQRSSINTLISFLEECELTGQSSSGIFNAATQSPNCGTSPYMMAKCAKVLLSLAKVPENRPSFIRYMTRLMDLSMSKVLRLEVTKILSSILYEAGLAEGEERT